MKSNVRFFTKKHLTRLCVISAMTLNSFAQAQSHDDIVADLTELYEAYPSLRTNIRPETMKEIAAEVLGSKKSERLIDFLLNNTDKFQSIRSSLLTEISKKRTVGKAVVSGQSIVGMIAAAILAQSGYEVHTYEMRDDYIRNIQWDGRQSLVDMLASIDQALADQFLTHVAGPLDQGLTHICHDDFAKKRYCDDNNRKNHGKKTFEKGNPTRIPTTAVELMNQLSVMNMEAKHFEKFLKNYLDSLPNVYRHIGKVTLKPQDAEGNYSLEGHGPLDLIVIAEGSNSSNKKILGIESTPISPVRQQVTGVVHLEGNGSNTKHWRSEQNDILLTGLMAQKGINRTWVLGDINPTNIIPGTEFGSDKTTPKYKAEKQRLINNEFRRLAAGVMELPLETIQAVEIDGFAEGFPIAPFALQQQISSKAAAGNNAIIIGDAVGNNHWSIGGGMQVGAVRHGEQLKELLLDIERKSHKTEALQKYSESVLLDTYAWGQFGINYFFPRLDEAESVLIYDESVRLWHEGVFSTPEEGMNVMMPEGPMGLTPKLLGENCSAPRLYAKIPDHNVCQTQ